MNFFFGLIREKQEVKDLWYFNKKQNNHKPVQLNLTWQGADSSVVDVAHYVTFSEPRTAHRIRIQITPFGLI